MCLPGEFYGLNPPTANLEMLSRFYAKYPQYMDQTFLSVKGALHLDGSMKSDASTDYLRQSVTNMCAREAVLLFLCPCQADKSLLHTATTSWAARRRWTSSSAPASTRADRLRRS